jgi:hypothetical protein
LTLSGVLTDILVDATQFITVSRPLWATFFSIFAVLTVMLKPTLIFGGSLVWVAAVSASLSLNYQFNGKGNWSIDATGSNATPVGTVQASVPVGATVEAAFLYTALWGEGPDFGDSIPPLVSVDFAGNLLTLSDYVYLGVNTGAATRDDPFPLEAYRADVTSIVQAAVGGGSASLFDFPVNTENPTDNIDGHVLAIVYRDPSEVERTIAFLDGSSDSLGDAFQVSLDVPLGDPTAAGFEALLSLGIGFSFQGKTQVSQVDVNGRRLTSSAGGQDDGFGEDGALITAGGIGDSFLNPPDPNASPASPRSDDELYNLAFGNAFDPSPFLKAGDTDIRIRTFNPSRDDNIFFAGFNITAKGEVIVDPTVPEPSAVGLLGMATVGLLLRGRRRS